MDERGSCGGFTRLSASRGVPSEPPRGTALRRRRGGRVPRLGTMQGIYRTAIAEVTSATELRAAHVNRTGQASASVGPTSSCGDPQLATLLFAASPSPVPLFSRAERFEPRGPRDRASRRALGSAQGARARHRRFMTPRGQTRTREHPDGRPTSVRRVRGDFSSLLIVGGRIVRGLGDRCMRLV